MQILIGDEVGLVKEFVVGRAREGNDTVARSLLRSASNTHLAKPDAAKSVRYLAVSTPRGGGGAEFFVACADGSLHRGISYRDRRSTVGREEKKSSSSSSSSSSSCSIVELALANDEDKAISPRGLVLLDRANDGNLPTIVTCDVKGRVRVLASNGKDFLTASSASFAVTPTTKASVRIENMRCNHAQTHIAVTGKEQDLLVCDLEKNGAVSFASKNVPHDHLDRALPIWGTDLGFMDESGNTVAVCTAYDRVRLFDVRTSPRRPVVDLNLQPSSPGIRARHLNALVSLGDGRDVVVADNFGKVSRVCMVGGPAGKGVREMGTFAGASGSVSALALDIPARRLVCGGLDRYVRVYDVDTREMVVEAFCKQRTTALCCVGNEENEMKKSDDDDEDAWFESEEEEEDDLEPSHKNKKPRQLESLINQRLR